MGGSSLIDHPGVVADETERNDLYFSGTPTFVLALGSVFSALEVVLPIGLIQTWASVEHGYRIPGDILFAAGIAATVCFIFGVGRGTGRAVASPLGEDAASRSLAHPRP